VLAAAGKGENQMQLRTLAWRVLALTVTALALIPATAGAYQVQDDQVATSFDGTEIVYTMFAPDNASASNPVPAVMRTHGWGGSRETTPTGFVQQLLDNGYAVLTWDSRGFGESGGTVEIDSPDYEARDASALIDVLAADPRIAKKKGDPQVGMSGGSYAGGVQWVTDATDHRVDAIAPEISWHKLLDSLYPETVVKTGWGALLYGAGQTAVTGGVVADPTDPETGNYDPAIHQAFVEGSGTGQWSQQTQDFFAHRGPDYLLGNVTAPTFIIQGTIDTLFPPSQGAKNYAAMKSLHPRQPLKMAWYCSGHGTCEPFDSGPANYTQDQIVKWFDRYVKGNKAVDTGSKFEYVTDDGVWHGAGDYPVAGTTTRSASGSGTVAINGGPTATGLLPGTDAPASLELPLPSQPGTLIGAPTVTLTENGIGTSTDMPNKAAVFFQVVNKTKGEVLGNQITPKVFATDGLDHTYAFGIEPISYTVDPGDQLVLQIASTSASYEAYRGGAVVNFKDIHVNMPQVP
jgi:ABC-2 type transport system ATP-binding protein